MSISTPWIFISSVGLFGRFIIALIIISFLYSKNKNDRYLKTGFITLLVLGGIVLVLSIIFFIFIFVFGGITILSKALGHYYWYF